MDVEVGHLGMWKEEKLYGSALLLLEELHFMMSCSILPVKSQASEQVLERLLLLILPPLHNMKLASISRLILHTQLVYGLQKFNFKLFCGDRSETLRQCFIPNYQGPDFDDVKICKKNAL
jgi:hypothetical protein